MCWRTSGLPWADSKAIDIDFIVHLCAAKSPIIHNSRALILVQCAVYIRLPCTELLKEMRDINNYGNFSVHLFSYR